MKQVLVTKLQYKKVHEKVDFSSSSQKVKHICLCDEKV